MTSTDPREVVVHLKRSTQHIPWLVASGRNECAIAEFKRRDATGGWRRRQTGEVIAPNELRPLTGEWITAFLNGVGEAAPCFVQQVRVENDVVIAGKLADLGLTEGLALLRVKGRWRRRRIDARGTHVLDADAGERLLPRAERVVDTRIQAIDREVARRVDHVIRRVQCASRALVLTFIQRVQNRR